MSNELENNVINQTLEDVQPNDDELQDFKNKMSEWLKLDEQIKKLGIAVKERKKLQGALESYIKDFMFKFNYHDVTLNNTKIKARQKETLVPLKTNDIKNKMLEYSNLSGQELIDKVFDINNRDKRTTNTVKRVIPKISHLSL